MARAGEIERPAKSIFLLRYVEEMDIAEIVQATGLSEGTVKAHLSRALGRVRQQLGGRA
jgi:RNA polymerase sigma-70 factor (ECF subfamily)